MNFEEKLNQKKEKQNFQKRRENKIKREIRKRDLEKIAQTPDKRGKIEKIKPIRKKAFETVIEKKKKQVNLVEDNMNVNTFLNISESYKKVLMRTKDYVEFDETKIQ